MNFQKIFKTNQDCNHNYRYEQIPHRHRDDEAYKGLPLVMHSNGTVCWLASDYLIDKFFSKVIKASSLVDEARSISRFIQFYDKEYPKQLLESCNDSTFVNYVDFLRDPENSKHPPQNNQINKLLSRVFNWLLWLQKKGYFKTQVISNHEESEAQVNVVQEAYTDYSAGKKIERKRLSHIAMLPYRDYVPRRPITDDTIDKLYDAIFTFTDNDFIQLRWQAILETLEQTGVRVSELALITTKAVSDAYISSSNSKYARLLVETTKGKNSGKSRKIPIPRSTIELLHSFMEYTRTPLVESMVKDGKLSYDHKRLFITDDGRPMIPKAISRHFTDVKNKAGIKEPASAHLFRHRYITIQVKRRLERLVANTNLYSVGLESFVTRKVMRLTGHAHPDSLLGYVDFAMEEMNVLGKVEENIKAEFESYSLLRELQKLLKDTKLKFTPSSKLKQILDFIKQMSIENSQSIA
jgi:integrase